MQAVILPCRLTCLLLSSLNAKGGMLVWNHNVFLVVVGVERLMARRNVDLFGGQLDAREVFEKVGVVSSVHVDVAEGGIARLASFS